MRRLTWVVALALLGCPERSQPERGLVLVFKKSKPDELRAVVDRRLARLKLKAHVQEDEQRLTVRLREGEKTDVGLVKKTLLTPAVLKFCPEVEPVSKGWCRLGGDGVEVERGDTCALRAGSRAPLEALLGDAGVALGWETRSDGVVVYTIDTYNCIEPHLTDVEFDEGQLPQLKLWFDKSTTSEFGKLTSRVVNQRLLIVLDDVVHSAPVVREPITGGRASIIVPRGADAKLLEGALFGGSLVGLTLEEEKVYGPPVIQLPKKP